MKIDLYHALTERLQTKLEQREEVLGLIALGSMAATDRQPDTFSDHDFFVITTTGVQQTYRNTTDWLPYPDKIVLHFQETDHGCKVIYDDGHLLEYAIFDTDELQLAQINSYRVLFQQIDLDALLIPLQEPVTITDNPDEAQRRYDTMLANILVGSLRARRGETLSGSLFIKQHALTSFMVLCWQQLAPDSPYRDSLDPMRRFEKQFPQLAIDLDQIIQLPVLAAGQALLRLIDTTLADAIPDAREAAHIIINEQLEQSE